MVVPSLQYVLLPFYTSRNLHLYGVSLLQEDLIMQQGPYRTFTWKVALLLLGPVVAAGLWLLIGVPQETPGLIVLSIVSGAFGLGGLALFIYILIQRHMLAKDILSQNPRLAILSDELYPGIGLWAAQMLKYRVLNQVHSKLFRMNLNTLPLAEAPFLFAYIQGEPVLWEWAGIKKYAKGVAQGSRCTIEYQGTMDANTRLLTHELGHLVLDHCTGIPAHEHHAVMVECGIEGMGFSEVARTAP